MMILAFILACGGGDKTSTDSDDADSGGPDVSGWSGGNFAFQTLAANDTCLGGAFEALFMPGGPSVPHDFEYEIYIPSYDDLPESYTIDLREPFVAMPVTVDSPDGKIYEIRGSILPAVELGRAQYGDCTVTMTVDVDLTPVSADTAEGTAVINISNPRGDDELCPVFEVSPCAVTLQLQANRA